MNPANPFQIPTCFQNTLEQRRRERFKKTIIAIVAGVVALLTVLLIQGCKSEHAKMASAMTLSATVATLPPAAPVTFSAAEPKPVSPPSAPASSAKTGPVAAPVVSKTGAAMESIHSETFYVVKPSDTLSRIAKAHGTTVKAIKATNGLATDTIAIGMKLKLPEA